MAGSSPAMTTIAHAAITRTTSARVAITRARTTHAPTINAHRCRRRTGGRGAHRATSWLAGRNWRWDGGRRGSSGQCPRQPGLRRPDQLRTGRRAGSDARARRTHRAICGDRRRQTLRGRSEPLAHAWRRDAASAARRRRDRDECRGEAPAARADRRRGGRSGKRRGGASSPPRTAFRSPCCVRSAIPRNARCRPPRWPRSTRMAASGPGACSPRSSRVPLNCRPCSRLQPTLPRQGGRSSHASSG